MDRYGSAIPEFDNKLVTEFDFVMGIGSIVPHRVKGTSGGAKIMFPGISGKEMMEMNQWEASMHMSETVMGVPARIIKYRNRPRTSEFNADELAIVGSR